MILSIYPHIGTILGRFPGRYTRPKTGIFSRSQYESFALQNFVLRHIGRMALRLSRDCPISRLPLTFTHGEISQKNFRKNFGLLLLSQIFRKSPAPTSQSPAEFAPFRTFSQESAKPCLCYIPQKFFQKNFSQIFSILGRLRRKCGKCYIARNFSQIFFSKKFWNFLQINNTPPVRS